MTARTYRQNLFEVFADPSNYLALGFSCPDLKVFDQTAPSVRGTRAGDRARHTKPTLPHSFSPSNRCIDVLRGRLSNLTVSSLEMPRCRQLVVDEPAPVTLRAGAWAKSEASRWGVRRWGFNSWAEGSFLNTAERFLSECSRMFLSTSESESECLGGGPQILENTQKMLRSIFEHF